MGRRRNNNRRANNRRNDRRSNVRNNRGSNRSNRDLGQGFTDLNGRDRGLAKRNPRPPAGRSLHLPENTNQSPGEVADYTCTLSTPSGTWNFEPDPVRIQWGLTGQINLMVTRGGQVAYSSGRTIGPLTIMGYMRSRWDLLGLGEFVGQHMRDAQLLGEPARFTYPEREIDFSVYVQNMNEIGLDGEQGEIVGFTLTCVVTEDHTALTQATQSFLMNLPENIEWIDVESAAKIAESRFGPIFNPASESSTSETADPAEDKSAEEEDVAKDGNDLGSAPDPGFANSPLVNGIRRGLESAREGLKR